jgi:serine/threonine protein kinase
VSAPQADGVLCAGTRLGRYVVLGEIGAGGTGVVYAAHDPELGRRVAVKLLRSPVREARLVREARALARLAHPNVVAVYDVGTLGERVFVAMELVEGATLRRWLEERPRAWREALDVLAEAGRGLAAAHAKGIVHRDVKPDNVIIGADGRVRVLDFGLVSDGAAPAGERAPEPASGGELAGRLTETGALMGTPAYMAPEQFRAEEADARTDQWSYCATLWEAVHGERPFRGATMRELAGAVTGGALHEPPRDRGVPGWLRRALARGLSVDRDARHPSMDALLAALDAGLAREQAMARLVGRRYERLPAVSVGAIAGGERAVDRLTGAVVTVVRVGPSSQDGEVESGARLALARAFRRLAVLRHPNLVSVLDFGLDQGGAPYFVLDHRGAGPEVASADRSRPGQLKLEQLVQLLRALAYLHRHGVTHGAIAPDAVLLAGERLGLVPLGAEVAKERASLAYTAPEVARGGAPSPAADLYSIGVLAYELLAFRHPFGGAPRAGEAPDLAAIEVEPRAAPVIARLLEADPAARYASAEDVIAALAEATSRPLAADTNETRESFLAAAPLVGRDGEVGRLHEALREAEEGRGSAWLVGGESGAGKSRLLDELRVLALAGGALVLRGQEEREGGSPYRLFRRVLRRLALLEGLDDLEAGVILPIVPDLASVLGRPVPPAPELDAPSMHARVVDVVERVLRRQGEPMVLLLEDLQWSRSDSLKLLQAIHPLAREAPLLIAATYRDDERPRLRDELPGMTPMDLGRLPEPAIADLAAAMIGEAGRRADLVALLGRETEGNAFFVVEVVRALAEEAGGLQAIGAAALPDKVLSGGIRHVVERRLRRAPEEARALLRTAAVIGRTIDPRLLAALAPEADLDAWVGRCVEASVLERTGDEARFAHDKLREGLLAEMGDDERRLVSGRVAGAIEQVYAGAPSLWAALSHHFGEAGDEAKEARYAALAGELGLQNGAWHEARKLLERALAIAGRSSAPPSEIARIQRGLAQLFYVERSFPEAHARAVAAIEAAGVTAPHRRFGRAFLVLFQVLVQALHLVLRGRGAAPTARRRDELSEASRAATILSQIFTYDNDHLGIVAASLVGLNTAERAGGTNILATATLGYIAGSAGLPRLSRTYFARVRDFQPGPGELGTLMDAQFYEGVFLLGQARLDEAEALNRRTMALAEQSGDGFHLRFAESFSGMYAYYRGSLAEAREWCGRSVDRIDPSVVGNAVLFACLEAPVLCALGRPGEAHERMMRHRPSLASLDHGSRVHWWGTLALVHVGLGDVDAAVEAADSSLRGLLSVRAQAPVVAPIFAGTAAAYLAGWKQAVERGGDEGPMIRRARRALRLSASWAAMYPLGRPQALLDRGRAERLRGREAAARRSFQRALEVAARLGLGLHEAEARRELQRSVAGGDAGAGARRATVSMPM